jgi:hypothetical protein
MIMIDNQTQNDLNLGAEVEQVKPCQLKILSFLFLKVKILLF